MASTTSNQEWSKGLDAGTYCKYQQPNFKTVNAAYFQRKIQLSGFSAYADGLPSKVIRISGVLLYSYATQHLRVQEHVNSIIKKERTDRQYGVTEKAGNTLYLQHAVVPDIPYVFSASPLAKRDMGESPLLIN